VSYVDVEYGMSERHSSRLLEWDNLRTCIGAESGTGHRVAKATERAGGKRMQFGYRRLTTLLMQEGVAADRKRIYRLYREEGIGDKNSATTADSLELRGGRSCSDQAKSKLVDGFRE
jgi:hypothetical protein